VYVCEGGDHPALLTNWCVIKDIHFVHGDDTDALNSSQQVRVKTRYASPLVSATIGIPQQQQQQKVSLFCRSAYEKATTTTASPSSPSTTAKSSSPPSSSPPLLQITFVSPEKAVSIGQAVVMYHHSTSRVLGVGSVAYHGRTVFEEELKEEQRRKQRQSEKKNDDDKES
jgi:tRNA U34 2-thiouridine synthase MnmA/TrmU